jgi:hypothetical protein
MTPINTLLPVAGQLDALLAGLPAAKAHQVMQPLIEACREATVRAYAREALARVPSMRSIQSSSEWATGDEGQSYIDWHQITCTLADGTTVAFNDISMCRDCGEYLRYGHEHALAELEEANPDREPGMLEIEYAAGLLGIEPDDLDAAVEAMWDLIFVANPEGEERPFDVLALAVPAVADEGATHAAWLGHLFDAVQGCELIPAVRRRAIAGLLDPTLERHGIERHGATEYDNGAFPDIRAVFAGAELPGEEDSDDRMYLKLEPFDLKIKRTDEGLICELYARDGQLESLASCFAFDSDATPEDTEGREAQAA